MLLAGYILMGYKSAIRYFACRITFYVRTNYVELNRILNLGFSSKWSLARYSCLYSGESSRIPLPRTMGEVKSCPALDKFLRLN
jgi:hypothetical protein